MSGVIVVVGALISLTIIFAIIGVPAIIFGFLIAQGSAVMAWGRTKGNVVET